MKPVVFKNSPMEAYYKSIGQEYEIFGDSEQNKKEEVVEEEMKKTELVNEPFKINLFQNYLSSYFDQNPASLPQRDFAFRLVAYLTLETVILLLLLLPFSIVTKATVVISMVPFVFFITFRKTYVENVHQINLECIAKTREEFERFFKIFRKCINVIVEMELIFRGFRISYPYPPITRIEMQNFESGVHAIQAVSIRLSIVNAVNNIRKVINSDEVVPVKSILPIRGLKEMFREMVLEKDSFFENVKKMCSTDEEAEEGGGGSEKDLFFNFCSKTKLSQLRNVLEESNRLLSSVLQKYFQVQNKYVFCKDKIFVYETNLQIAHLCAELNIMHETVLSSSKRPEHEGGGGGGESGRGILENGQYNQILQSIERVKEVFMKHCAMLVRESEELRVESTSDVKGIHGRGSNKVGGEKRHNTLRDLVGGEAAMRVVYENGVAVEAEESKELKKGTGRNVFNVHVFEEDVGKEEVIEKVAERRFERRLPLFQKDFFHNLKTIKVKAYGGDSEEKGTEKEEEVEGEGEKEEKKVEESGEGRKSGKKGFVNELENVLEIRKRNLVEVMKLHKKREVDSPPSLSDDDE